MSDDSDNNKFKTTTKFTIVEQIDCDWCALKVMSVVVSYEHNVAPITFCHINSCEIIINSLDMWHC